MMEVAREIAPPAPPDDWDSTVEDWQENWIEITLFNMWLDSKVAPEHRPDEYVYFLRAIGGEIKIGYATNPHRRLGELQVGQPADLEMLCYVEGGKDLETDLHREFAGDHIRGEWFRSSDRLMTRMLWLFCNSVGR